MYFIGTAIAFLIAFYGTIMQVSEIIECPKTSTGIPMCFISLSIFTTLIITKAYLIKLKRF
ncbi:hypothetical protein [uncultured Formosa sp.]|uniref:hypothetical protein n=1 Tax=uncultured Formosa sp. TaxID=255435 RepID=UPI00261C62B2|nr:hypothetical protein [uncultured Formosa sp.]